MKMAKQLIGFTVLGIGVYLTYTNMDKIKGMVENMKHKMNNDDKLENML